MDKDSKKNIFTKIDSPNGREAKKLNLGYNTDVTPEGTYQTMDHMPGTNNKEIPIGCEDPVKMFRQWRADYWKPFND